MSLKVDQNRAKHVALSLRPVVDTERHDRICWRQWCSAHQAQQRSRTDGHPRRYRVARSGITTQREAMPL
jgi:hypothetical protein